MSYISAIRSKEIVKVWERRNKRRVLVEYDAPFYFYSKDDDGEYKDLYGNNLKRHDFETMPDLNALKDEYKIIMGKSLYESDITPELKILSSEYYNKEAPKLHISLYDIEVDYDPEKGFPAPGLENSYAEINSVSIYNYWEDKIYLIAIPPNDENPDDINVESFKKDLEDIEKIELKYELSFVSTEKELLKSFLKIIKDCDLIAGWNSEGFDDPYIAARIYKVLGRGYFNELSFPEAPSPKWTTFERFGEDQTGIDFCGRINTDYLALYKKYKVVEQPSYKLESIAELELPEMRKLEFPGTLYTLYRDNFTHFVRYNMRDVEILHGFEEKLGYIDVANQMYHSATGLFNHVFGTLKTTELSIINYCHYDLDCKVNDTSPSSSDDTITGAYVLEPKIGQHKYIASIDIASLYPSAIRAINISPETLVGQFSAYDQAFEAIKNDEDTKLEFVFDKSHPQANQALMLSASKWRKELKKLNWSVSGYGTVFNQSTKGVLPAILENWYSTRKEYQKLKKNTKSKTKASYYDRLQYVYKIKLNSAYGALCNKYFRFYDLRMGASTTLTGQSILKHQCSKTNEVLTGEYDLKGEAIIYGDTDSTYFKTFAKNDIQATQVGDIVTKKVSDSFRQYMQDSFLCAPGYDDMISAGREIIGSSSIFIKKKMYIINVIDDEGKKVDKLKSMGVSLKKTTLPKEFQNALSDFVKRILKNEDWDSIAEDIVKYKSTFKGIEDIKRIGLPIGVKNMEKYTNEYKKTGKDTRLPGNVAGSLNWNLRLEEYKDNESIVITSGTKIKIFYLKMIIDKKFKSIAIPTDQVNIPNWFKDNYIELIDVDAQLQRLIDKPLEHILTAIGKEVPTPNSLLLNELLVF